MPMVVATHEASGRTARGGPAAARRRREYGLFALFALPNVAIIAVFGLYPAVVNIGLSFTDWDLISPDITFVGLDNYQWVFTSPEFRQVLWVTLVFTVVVVGVNLVLGFLLALLLNQKLRGAKFVRTVTFAPYVLSGAAVGMVWLFIFDPNFGLARVGFSMLGASSPGWVTSPQWALPAIIIVHIWKGVGFVTVVYIAALQGLPQDLFEAADIDGASPWQKLRRVTIPLLSPVTFFITIMITISTTQAFDVIAVMTGGGPSRATSILSWYIYQQAFSAFNIGHASASAVVLFVVLLGFFLVQARGQQRAAR